MIEAAVAVAIIYSVFCGSEQILGF